jgi:UDP-N-acetylmuramyl tripeptide synthase
LFFASTGAVLELPGTLLEPPGHPLAPSRTTGDALIAGWRRRVEGAALHLGWAERATAARRHLGGVSLAIAAPCDQLFLATEVNEWAVCAALNERDPIRWNGLERALIDAAILAAADSDDPTADPQPVLEESAALARFAQLSAREGRPRLRALLAAAIARSLPYLIDDAELTLGAGTGARNFWLDGLPDPVDVPWEELHDIPTAIVTGSNGKTTTVRLLAACAREHGWHTAYNCTDGVFLDHSTLAVGDYSGPAGTRLALRERRTQAAILETARGGILRRGIAVSQVRAAVITNVSPDHFGEYGIDDLEGIAQAKFAVAAVVATDGLLVLNADDAHLRSHLDAIARRGGRMPPIGWFSVSPDPGALQEHRARGAPTCAVQEGHLIVAHGDRQHDLGLIASMPLTMSGSATYNIANLAGAALVAVALGIAPATIAAVFAKFGADIADNPGRLMRFKVRGATVLVDYAHNADGLRGFLTVAEHVRGGTGRLGLLLGQAGNRKDADIEDLTRVVADFEPALVVVKENETQLRGRAPGEVPRIIRAALERRGLPPHALPMADTEVEAAHIALDWARPGDVLALPVHSSMARAAVIAMLAKESST